MSTAGLEPLLFSPVLLPKVWGGRRLTQLDKAAPSDERIGESWELADLAATSAAGAGGQAVRTRIADGPLAGRTLREAIESHGETIMGTAERSKAALAGGFPLLFKFLDASQNLSVQVHPSPGHASRTPGAHLKTESWYIIAADPGALLYIGMKPGIARTAFALAARNNDPRIIDMLRDVPAVPGDCHTLPSGTIHALGAGVLVAEVQTASDTTYRIHDWGRRGRELHIAEALRCCRFEDDPVEARIGPDGPPTVARLGKFEARARIAATDRYFIDEIRPSDARPQPLTDEPAPVVVMVLDGAGSLNARPVSRGQTFLVPAASSRSTTLSAVRALVVTLRG